MGAPGTAAGSLPSGCYLRLGLMQLHCVAAVLLLCSPLYFLPSILMPLWRVWLAFWLVAEVGFIFVFRRKLERLNKVPTPHHPKDLNGNIAFNKWTNSGDYVPKTVPLEEYMAVWFPDIPTEKIQRGNVAEMLSYGFWYKSRAEMESEGKGHIIDHMLLQVEDVFSARYSDGTNPDLTYYTHLNESLKVLYKPMAFYAFCEGMAGLKHIIMLASGFRCHTFRNHTYYTYQLRTPTQVEAGELPPNDKQPIVFLHGVGAGLLPYVHIVQQLAALGHPIVAVEYKHLSMRWTDFLPDALEVGRDMAGVLDLHGIDKVFLVGHSFGTFYASTLLKLAPERVSGMCLIDPACCCMWSGHLIANFVYRPHRSTTGLITWFIARDIHTSASTARNFFWTEYNLWPQEVPINSVIVLSGRDDLVPVKHVQAMVENETSAKLIYNPKMCHADFLFSFSCQMEILGAVQEMLLAPPSTPKPASEDSSPRAPSKLVSAFSSTSTISSTISSWDYINDVPEFDESCPLASPKPVATKAAAAAQQLVNRSASRGLAVGTY